MIKAPTRIGSYYGATLFGGNGNLLPCRPLLFCSIERATNPPYDSGSLVSRFSKIRKVRQEVDKEKGRRASTLEGFSLYLFPPK